MGAHIVFARFPSLDSFRIRPWTQHAAEVTGSEPAASSAGSGVVVWQLSSANHRQLARSALVHRTVLDAIDDASTVMRETDGEVILVRKDGAGAFGWYLATPYRILALCPRWYATERERRHSIDLVTGALPGAQLSLTVRVVGADHTEELPTVERLLRR
jgi:hypothetical protein